MIVSCLLVGLLFAGPSPFGANLSAMGVVLVLAFVFAIGAIGFPLVLISSIAFFYSVFLAASTGFRHLGRTPVCVRSPTKTEK